MHVNHEECRQGSVLTQESARSLGLISPESINQYCVIVSHDCDIISEKEPKIEYILAEKLPKPSSSYLNAAHPRCLHIPYQSNTSDRVILELTHAQRREIAKEQFLNHRKVDTNLILTDKEKRYLKQWLAARYGRSAFPNNFEARLRLIKKFDKKIDDILSPDHHHIVGTFFFLGDDRTSELPQGTPYCLTITLVYDGIKGTPARLIAEDRAQKITTLFHDTYGTPEVATEIALEKCQAISDMYYSFAEIRRSDQWRAESISLQDPNGEFLPIGQMPT